MLKDCLFIQHIPCTLLMNYIHTCKTVGIEEIWIKLRNQLNSFKMIIEAISYLMSHQSSQYMVFLKIKTIWLKQTEIYTQVLSLTIYPSLRKEKVHQVQSLLASFCYPNIIASHRSWLQWGSQSWIPLIQEIVVTTSSMMFKCQVDPTLGDSEELLPGWPNSTNGS